ncbi:Protein ELYS [Cytospora mali]|uniref:Protein ELYS n=1 Tax=Cytospora mali TaxID=578113 RepID=A0A194W706_CYTMA|nr:Protein ELYS [Valsa mali]
MPNFNDIHQVFKPEWGSPYTQEFSKEADIYRKRLNGALFIDRVLKALGITKPKSYPPKGDNGLYQLHQQICESHSSVHQKLSVFYYLLLDFNEHLGTHTRTSFADIFASRFALPKKYETFMKGLWNMDRQQFNLALEDLAHPSLSQEFSDDIITTLVQNAKNEDYSFALAYYHTVKPVLNDPTALEHLFEAMARTSLTEAFYFARTHPEQARRLLFQQLIASVLEGRGSVDTATRATELVSLPLDSAEEQWFEEYLTSGDGRKLRKAKDTVLMRRMVTGRHAESMNDRNLGGQWGVVLGGFKSGMGGRVA